MMPAVAAEHSFLCRGLFEEHKRLFSFLLCTSILRHKPTDGIPEVEWSCLIRGPATTLACQHGAAANSSHDRPKPQQLEWLSEQAWAGLQALEQCLPQLQGLVDSWQQQAAAWKQWYGCNPSCQAHHICAASSVKLHCRVQLKKSCLLVPVVIG